MYDEMLTSRKGNYRADFFFPPARKVNTVKIVRESAHCFVLDKTEATSDLFPSNTGKRVGLKSLF